MINKLTKMSRLVENSRPTHFHFLLLLPAPAFAFFFHCLILLPAYKFYFPCLLPFSILTSNFDFPTWCLLESASSYSSAFYFHFSLHLLTSSSLLHFTHRGPTFTSILTSLPTFASPSNPTDTSIVLHCCRK